MLICICQDRGYVWKGSKEEENVLDDHGSYQPDDPSTEEVKFKEQKPEENVFDGLEVSNQQKLTKLTQLT